MTPAQKVTRDIATLQDSLRQDWKDLAALDLSPAERKDVHKHMKWCAAQLNFLVVQFEILDSQDA